MKSATELRERLGEAEYKRQVFDPAAAAADDFARGLRRRSGGALVVTPAPFVAPDWSQPEYLSLWETLIRTRFREVYFNRGWQYSNGCAFELAVAADARLPCHDADGRPLALAEARALITVAIAEVETQGFDAATLRLNLGRLEEVAAARQAAGVALSS
jgi:hypothetical protein